MKFLMQVENMLQVRYGRILHMKKNIDQVKIQGGASYEKEYFQYNVKETYQDIKKISLKLYNKLKNIWE